MRPDVVRLLACPVCDGSLAEDGASLLCPAGHRFDIARQGYVSLLGRGAQTGTGDTAQMVAARVDFLGAGHFAPLTAAVAEQVRGALPPGGGVVVDLGAGTGHHLAAVLDGADALGVALDASKYAARAAARAHPRIGAVVCDVWRRLPLRADIADVVLNVFAPRNIAEAIRVLRPGGALVMVTPTAEHLAGIVVPLGLLTVDPDKRRRLAQDLTALTLQEQTSVSFPATLDRAAVTALVQMGPSAHHVAPGELEQRLAAIDDPVTVTCSVDVSLYAAGGSAASRTWAAGGSAG